MKKSLLSFIAAAAIFLPYMLRAGITLAENGSTRYTIVADTNNYDPFHKAALTDLRNYLREMTGAEFLISDPPGKIHKYRIFVGRKPPVKLPPLGERERRIISVGNDIYIYGEGRFGTPFAIYDFLDDLCGCRWYTVWGDMYIPRKNVLKFDKIDFRRKPSFITHEMGSSAVLVRNNPAIKDFLRRNRVYRMLRYSEKNGTDSAWNYVGPSVHSIPAYLPPGEKYRKAAMSKAHPALKNAAYFDTNPEWFAMNERGKRIPTKHLCFSNPELAAELIKNIRKVIKYEKYDKKQRAILTLDPEDSYGSICRCDTCRKLSGGQSSPNRAYAEFTMNEGFHHVGSLCCCDNCDSLAQKHRTPAAAFLKFIIRAAEDLKPDYPKLKIRFLVYLPRISELPPEGLKLPDNVEINMAPLTQDFTHSFNHPHNRTILERIQKWGKTSPGMWFWLYPVAYPNAIHIYALLPNIYRNAENMRVIHQNGCRYIVSEIGGSLVQNSLFKELNLYVMAKLTSDINADVEELIREFCRHYYGSAADKMIALLKDMTGEGAKDTGFFIYNHDPRILRSLHSPENLLRWQKELDKMENAAVNPLHKLHIARIRISLDAITLMHWNQIAKVYPQYVTPKNALQVYSRYLNNVKRDLADMYSISPVELGRKHHFSQYLDAAGRMFYRIAVSTHKAPAVLTDRYGTENVSWVIPNTHRHSVKRWREKDAAAGYAIEVEPNKSSFGITYYPLAGKIKDQNRGYYEPFTAPSPLRPEFFNSVIKKTAGYKPYYLGRAKLMLDSQVFFISNTRDRRNLNSFYIGEKFDAADPEQLYDLYMNIKYDKGVTMLTDCLYLCKVAPDAPVPQQ